MDLEPTILHSSSKVQNLEVMVVYIAWEDPIKSHIPYIVNIKRIVISHGQSIDSIQVDYELLWGDILQGDKHGGDGGSADTIELEEGEVIIQVHAKTSDVYLDQISFTSLKLDGTYVTHGPYGNTQGPEQSVSVYGKVIGFYGNGGDVLDALGIFLMGC